MIDTITELAYPDAGVKKGEIELDFQYLDGDTASGDIVKCYVVYGESSGIPFFSNSVDKSYVFHDVRDELVTSLPFSISFSSSAELEDH